MTAFNTVFVRERCPSCKENGDFEVQFKYGNCWQINYVVGDYLRWGGNDVGTKGLEKVMVEGMAGPCPNCGVDYIKCEIYLSADRIIRVVLLEMA